MNIRPATQNDLEQISAIYNHAVKHSAVTFDTEEKSPEHFNEYLYSEEYFHFLCVAEKHGRIIGYAGLYPFSKRKAYVCMSELTCYVHPDFHGSGAGYKLLAYVDEYTKSTHLHTVLALFNSSNRVVEKIVKALGFNYKGEMEEVAQKLGVYHSMKIYQKIY